MTYHRTSVEPTPDGRFTAACTCGLHSPGWATDADAFAITAGHLEELQED